MHTVERRRQILCWEDMINNKVLHVQKIWDRGFWFHIICTEPNQNMTLEMATYLLFVATNSDCLRYNRYSVPFERRLRIESRTFAQELQLNWIVFDRGVAIRQVFSKRLRDTLRVHSALKMQFCAFVSSQQEQENLKSRGPATLLMT